MKGNIQRRSPGSFTVRIEGERDATGRRKQITKTIKGSYKDAQRELARMQADAHAGVLVDPSTDTIGVYLQGWLDNALGLSPKTLERYVELAQRQIIPHLGDLKLQKLRPEHLEQWHATLMKGGLSARTVGHAHRVLSRVLRRAVENGTISRNVALIRKPPKVEQTEIEILSDAQIKIVLEGLADHPLHVIAHIALATGMRRGELLGLRWDDVDFDRRTIRVERSLEETKSGLRIKPPKTKRGRRSVGITGADAAILKEHRKSQIEHRLALGQGGQPELVFSTIEGDLLPPDNLSRDWRRVCRTKKLPLVSFHALRHTHASQLIRAGVDVLTISRRLGHGKASVTLDTYGHLIDGADDDAVKAMEGKMK